MKRSTLQLIKKLARDVRRGDEMCDYNPVFMDLFGNLFVELTQCLDIIPYLEATPARHPEEFGDPRVINYLTSFWLQVDPFEGKVYNPATGHLATIYDDDIECGGPDAQEGSGQNIPKDKEEEEEDLPF